MATDDTRLGRRGLLLTVLDKLNALSSQVSALQEIVMSNQDALNTDVANLNAEVQGMDSDITAAFGRVDAEIAALKAANPALDLTGLESAISALHTERGTVEAAYPDQTPPVPTT